MKVSTLVKMTKKWKVFCVTCHGCPKDSGLISNFYNLDKKICEIVV